jgi:hypothetical protein
LTIVTASRLSSSPGPLLHVDLVHLANDPRQPVTDLLATEEEVLDDVEVVGQGEVLVDGRDSEGHCVGGIRDVHLLSLEADAPGVGGMDPGDRLDQG